VQTGRRVGRFGEEHTDYVLLNIGTVCHSETSKIAFNTTGYLGGKAAIWISSEFTSDSYFFLRLY